MATAIVTETRAGLARPGESQRTLSRAVWMGLVIVAACVAVLKVVGVGIAEWAQHTRYSSLTELVASWSSHAAVRLAERESKKDNWASAEAFALKAVRIAPYSASTLRTFGLVLAQHDKSKRAGRAMTLAAGLGWRDTPTQLWLLDAYSRNGDYGAALERAEALYRRGQYVTEMRAIFVAASLNPRWRTAVISRLRARPPWRNALFTSVSVLPPSEMEKFGSFLEEFEVSEGRLTSEETAPFISLLAEKGDHRRGRAAWIRYSGEEWFTKENEVLDAGFELATINGRSHYSPFEWGVAMDAGNAIQLAMPPGGRSRALRVVPGARARRTAVRQVLVLNPGSFVISLERMMEQASAQESVEWTLQCLPSWQEIELGPHTTKVMSLNWSRLTYTFQIPAHRCDAQRLQLKWGGKLSSGEVPVWFDNITVTPLSAS